MKRVLAATVLALASVAAVVVAAGGESERAPAAPAEDAEVFASTGGALTRIDPATLRPLGPRLTIQFEASAFSPDRGTLAITGPVSTQLRLVDLRRMRLVPRGVDLGRMTYVDTLHWLDAGTIAVATWGAPPRLLAIDVAGRRIAARRDLPGQVFARVRTQDALVLLVGPAERIGASTLVVVDGDGVRTARLGQIAAGYANVGSGQSGEHRKVAPGLAVDPDGRRAVVVPPSGRVAEIDLASLSVRYHELTRPVSLLGRVRDWLEPQAFAKSTAGPERYASWVGDSAVAVVAIEQVGIDERSGEHRQLGRARGVELIDTRRWTVRTLSERAGGAAVAGDTVLVYGGAFAAGAPFSADDGPRVTGLRGFGAGGREHFSILRSREVGHVQTAGRYAYATARGPVGVTIVDAATGRVVAEAPTAGPIWIVE